MPRIETSRTDWYRLAITVIFCAVLAACTPEGQIQETNPAVTQTIEGVGLIVEPGTPIMTMTATLENTPTSTNTATITTTPTETATPTPKAPEFPSDLVIDEDLRINREYRTEYGEGYKTRSWRIIIREQDLHLDEPFTLRDGRYHVQAWADAWFMDTDGKGYHLSIPLIIYDTERSHAAGYFNGIWMMDSEVEGAKEVITKFFTGLFNDNAYINKTGHDLLDSQWCFTDTQYRNCGEKDMYPIFMETGYIPSPDINMSSRKWDPIRIYIEEFHREFLADIYTQENIEAFWQDPNFSTRSLQFPDNNVPVNFFVPLAMPIMVGGP